MSDIYTWNLSKLSVKLIVSQNLIEYECFRLVGRGNYYGLSLVVYPHH